MGLFKSKKKESNLDIPPPPPLEMNSSGPGDTMNDMPPEMAPHDSIPQQDTLFPSADNAPADPFPPLGDDSFPAPPADDFPPMPAPQMDAMPPPEEHMPPPIGAPHEDIDTMSQNMLPPEPATEEHLPPPSFHPQESFHEQPHPMPSNALFVEVSKYKGAMRELNNIKKSLKQSDNEIKELIQDMEAEEVTFQELHENLTSVEQKLLDLESSLFNQ